MARKKGSGGGQSPALTRQDIKRVLAVAKSQERGELYCAAIQVLLCGLRIGELAAITKADLCPGGGNEIASSFVLGSTDTKSGKARTCFLTRSAREALTPIVSRLSPSERVFPWNSSYSCHKISSLLKLAGFNATTHSFRRTCLQLLQQEQSLKIQQLQAIAGHSSPAVTLRYLDRNPRPIQDAFAKLSF